MILKGLHHVSAITANARKNYEFYSKVLGMRLVKKSVNQDATSMYHLFYADEIGNPGTDLTFFEIPNAGRTYQGNNSISRVSLRVPNDNALNYWVQRFNNLQVDHDGISEQNGHHVIHFRDHENQRLTLISDEKNQGVAGGIPWKHSHASVENGIVGLGPVKITVPDSEPTVKALTKVLSFKKIGSYPSPVLGQKDILVFSTGEGGNGAEVHLEVRNDLPRERPGKGSVHHVAFRVDSDEELQKWYEKLIEARMPNSGIVDRYYFKALYFRDQNRILFELSTDGPGFATDEDVEHLGEKLALPPFLEDQRAEIEANLEPLETKSTK